ATVGLQHHPYLEIPRNIYNNTVYYYPEDTATIIRYVGSFPNILGGDTSFSKWETISWAEKQKNTQIASATNNPDKMIYKGDSLKYMERSNILDFNIPRYYAKVRYADDKAPLLGNSALGKDPTENSGHLLVPGDIEVTSQVIPGSQVKVILDFKVKNEYRIYEYEIYKNDINNVNGGNLVLAATIEAKAKTNFDSGRYLHSYKFIDSFPSLGKTTDIYYQIKPIGGTGRGIKTTSSKSEIKHTKKLRMLGNPIAVTQGVVRYRFESPDLQYDHVKVVLVNSAGHVVAIETINSEQTKFYESNVFFSTQNIAAGVYILIAQATQVDGTVEVFTERVIVE
ncbi:MAG: hypothetical protein ACRC0A_03970, partial [Chitinophagaceae bacterium]